MSMQPMTQAQPISPFQFFQNGGPLGYWPNTYAANAGDLPNLLWATSLQTPLLNGYTPMMPPLVSNIFGGGPVPIGQGFRPAPIGFDANMTTLTQPASGGVVGSTFTSQGPAQFGQQPTVMGATPVGFPQQGTTFFA